MNKNILNAIINMAGRDNKIVEQEQKTIYMLGKASGFSKKEVQEMIENPQPVTDLSHYSEDERFEALYHTIQLMKTDSKVFKSEINYCEKIAEKLGYKKGVVSALSAHIYSNPCITANRDLLITKAKKYLK